MNKGKDYYQVLHVQRDAPVEVIRASYHSLMRDLKIHPDLGGSQGVASLLNEAYATLSDRVKRAAYDRDRSSFSRTGQDLIVQTGSYSLDSMREQRRHVLCRECASQMNRMRRTWWMRLFIWTRYYTCPVCNSSYLRFSSLLISL